MGNFNKGGKFGGHSFSDRDGERPPLHKAVCTDCGKPCEVPFKPTPGKSVFCRDCFKKDGDSGSDRFGGPKSFGKFERRDSNRGSFEDRPMFDATCAKCGESCQVPFKPNGEKPVLCKGCFSVAKGENFGPAAGKSEHFAKSLGARRPEQSTELLEKMNAKLERILKVLEGMGAMSQKKDSPKDVVKKEAAKEVVKAMAKEAPKKEVAKTAKKEVKAEKPAKAAKAVKAKKAK
jgi:CxxC-x17-CxxC domain-containing protein